MTFLNIKMRVAGSDDLVEVKVPARWAICPHCRGDGKSSEHLGAISGDEFHHQWSDEDRENYLSGMYDKPCGICTGLGRVMVPDDDVRLTAQQRAALAYAQDEEDEAAADRRTAWYESGCPQ